MPAKPPENGSRLLIGAEMEALLGRLLTQLKAERQSASPFQPSQIVVPSASMRDWLQREIARRNGIAIQIHFEYLENALWRIMQQYAPSSEVPLAQLDHERYRLLIFSLLISPEERRRAELKILARYLVPGENASPESSRAFWRRAWDCADRLARLIRDYEYHRQDEFISRWVDDKPAELGNADQFAAMEQCQRYIFRRIIDEKSGLRSRLSQAQQRAYKTLPQFANEVLFDPKLQNIRPNGEALPIHLFGIGQISAYHVRLLHWIGTRQTLHIYQHTPLAGRLDAAKLTPKTASRELRALSERASKDRNALMSCSAAAAAGLWRMAELFPAEQPSAFAIEVLSGNAEPPQTLLQRAQQALTQLGTEKVAPVDASVRVFACPGVMREVENVYHSICERLISNPRLRQNDIAILVSDMDLYRPALQTVFERRVADAKGKRTVPLALAFSEGSIAGISSYGRALIGMLELPLDGFRRKAVLDVLLNPCFLARQRINREQAAVWLKWAERLCVYHGWDSDDKEESGFTSSRLYSWRLALQRLRLGRIMDAGDAEAQPFRGVLPYADLDSSDAASLGAFCRSIEELLPRLIQLRRTPTSGAEWIERLKSLAQDFLEVPSDRADEAQIRDRIMRAIGTLDSLDAVTDKRVLLPLTAIVDFVSSVLEETTASAGGDSGGIVVAPIHSNRAVPARIVYVLGMNEAVFPPADVRTGFDLREAHRLPGDITASENGRGQFLDALLGAHEAISVSYSSRDLQKDEERYASGIVNRLRQWLALDEIRVGLDPSDPDFLAQPAPLSLWDADRRRMFLAAKARGSLSPDDAKRLDALKQDSAFRVEVGEQPSASPPQIVHITISQLAKFLRDPAAAALQLQLGLKDEYEDDIGDDEPFYAEQIPAASVLADELVAAAKEIAQGKAPQWQARLEKLCRTRFAKGESPDGVFAQLEQRRFERIMRSRVEAGPAAGLNGIIAQIPPKFEGAVQIGTTLEPQGAALRFPPLKVPLPAGPNGEERFALLNGTWPLVWRAERELTLLRIECFRKPPRQNSFYSDVFEPLLFYLALRAGTENGESGSSRAWSGDRALRLGFSCSDKNELFNCKSRSADAACDYLHALVRDVCDAVQIERMPFEVISEEDALKAAYAEANPRIKGDAYAALLKTAILDADEERFEFGPPRLRATDLLQIQDIPDAFDKVRRRFELLYYMWFVAEERRS